MFSNSKRFSKLTESIDWSIRQLEFQRRKFHEVVKMSTGTHYADGGSDQKTAINLMKITERIYVRLLAPQAPRAVFSSLNRQLLPTAANFTLAVNQRVKEINFDKTLARAVLEAIYAPMGIIKVGLASHSEVLGHDYGKSFADIVTFDDYFCDMSAKSEELFQYEGNDYWVSYEEFMDSKFGDKKSKNGVKPDEYSTVAQEGQDKTQSVTVNSTPKLYKDKIWLRDVWLPDERIMLTYGVTSKRVFHEAEMDDSAPIDGPYHRLGFLGVPGGNPIPMPPASMWRDMHELENALFNKMAVGADSQKTCLGFGNTDEKEIEGFKNACDGDGIPYTGAEPKELHAGGIDQKTLAFFITSKDLFSWAAGNLDSLGGLSPVSDTVGQEKILSEAASAMLRDMADKTVDFVRGIYRSLAKYEWDDPVNERILEKPIPGTEESIQVPWNRDTRVGRFDEYDLEIDIHSMQDQSPSIKLQKLRAFVQEFVVPLQPFIQQQGGYIDVKKIIDKASKCLGDSDLEEIVQFMEQDQQQQAEGPSKPANTTRTYDRVVRPGATQRGKDMTTVQALLGGNPQSSEMASLTRSNG